MKKSAFIIFTFIVLLCACSGGKEHMAEAVKGKDSTVLLTANGVSTLISDSGVIRYKLMSEKWEIHIDTHPETWKFYHGFFMERYNQQHSADLYVQADTAFLHKQSIWELRGRVIVKNLKGTLFLTEELYWDMNRRIIYNNVPMDIYMPDRELHGTKFTSNEAMTDYVVQNPSGFIPASDTQSAESAAPTPPSPQPDKSAQNDSTSQA